MQKATPTSGPVSAKQDVSSASASPASTHRKETPAFDSFAGLHSALGNQHVLALLSSRQLQLKSNAPSFDPHEQEADRASELVTRRVHAPAIERKCAGGASCPCAKCSGAREPQSPRLSPVTSRVQLQEKDAQPANDSATKSNRRQRLQLIVEDDAPQLLPGQMKKTPFLAQLQAIVCVTVDAAIASTGNNTRGCPYIKKWLAFYSKKDSHHIERALRKYAPEAERALVASDYFPIVARRIERAAIHWAKTGDITDVPDELKSQFDGGGIMGAIGGFFSNLGGSILNFLSGSSAEHSHSRDRVQRKSRDGAAASDADPAEIKRQLGSGNSLDWRTRSHMSQAYGADFSRVRVHTDGKAATLSQQLNALAFTVGHDIAFAPGQYRPGTLVGDALLAHELAHVVQQSGPASHAAGSQTAPDDSRLESEADLNAAHAVTTTRPHLSSLAPALTQRSTPQLRSGPRLQRCHSKKQAKHPVPPAPAVTDTEPDMPALLKPIEQKFSDLPDGKHVTDPTGRKHGIELERRGKELFYFLKNGEERRVPRPVDPKRKPPAPAPIEKVTWAGAVSQQRAFAVDYEQFKGPGVGPLNELPTYSVNIFGRGSAAELISSLLNKPAAEVYPEGLEYEDAAGVLSQRPKAKRFEDAKRYHLPKSPFSLYVFDDRSAEVADDSSGRTLGGPWTKVLDLKVSPSGEVSLIRKGKSGEISNTFSLKGPKFSPSRDASLQDSKDRQNLISDLKALDVQVVERGSRFSMVELQTALSVLRNWKGSKGVAASLKDMGVPALKLVKDILNNAAEYDSDSNEVRIIGTVELTEEEQRNMVTHELTHTLFHARGLSIKKGAKVPEHVKKSAGELHDLSQGGDINEGVIKGPDTPQSIKNKTRTPEEWQKTLSTDADLNAIWKQMHTRFRIGDPEGTGDIRGMDAADESRYMGGSRGDPVGHGFDNVTEFMSSFVTSTLSYQTQLSATILSANSQTLARAYKQLWDWVNKNLINLGKQNPYDAILTKLQKH